MNAVYVGCILLHETDNRDTGPLFSYGLSIAIKITWKFRFTLISILAKWSLQIRSWHVHFFWIERTAIELQQGVYSIELELQENNR